jgi:hypothetical protein
MSVEPGDITVRSAGPLRAVQGSMLGRPLSEWRAAMRAELGVPAGTVAGTGHQPEWWHPGIAAKFMWAERLAEPAGAATLWLIVDTDVRDPAELRVPVEDAAGLHAALHRFGPRAAAGTPACARPARVPAPFDAGTGKTTPGCAALGAQRAFDAMQEHADEPDGVSQAMAAVRACTPELGTPACSVRASALLGTALGKAILDRAGTAEGAEACHRAFNDAVRLVPRVARPLAGPGPGRSSHELPFWTLGADGRRERVDGISLGRLRDEGRPLWPRAFLTSAIARAALCDRFVHGLGGGIYERATEAFARQFLGAELPPFDVASATLRLPFPADDGPPPLTHAARRARWFDPESDPAGDGHSPSARKRGLLAAIDAAPRGSAERRAAWRAMHADLAGTRTAHACEFMELEARAAADRERARSAAVRADRTWACVLHDPAAITRLRDRIRAHPA